MLFYSRLCRLLCTRIIGLSLVVRQQLAFAADKAAAIQASPRLTALMDFRHVYIAHNLTLPEPDMKTEATVAGVCLRRFVSGPE